MFKYNIRKEIFNGLIFILGAAGGTYFLYEKYKSWQVLEHPTRELAEMTLKLDPRVKNFCGKKYQIKHYRMISEDENYVTYRMKIEGIRGKCRVLVKCQKHTHAELKSHSLEQMIYSKKTKEQKASSLFMPYNYNDILIPTKETLKKMKDILKLKSLSDNILIFNRDSYLNGDYHASKDTELKVLKKPIENADTFYRITSLVMVANDNLVFNIRPIGPKYRTYDIEDTVYTYKTYEDVLKNIMNFRFSFSDVLMEEFSAEDYRSEIILQKQTNFQERTQNRKYMTLLNMVVMVAGYFIYKIYIRQKIDVTTIKSLQSKIINMNPKGKLGSTKRLQCISYNYSLLNSRFMINGLIMGEKGVKMGLQTSALVDDVSPHTSVTIYDLKSTPNKEKKAIKITI